MQDGASTAQKQEKIRTYDNTRLAGYIRWALLLLELTLLLRFLLALLGADSANALAAFLYNLTDLFLYPFERPRPIVQDLAFGPKGTYSFEWTTLIAMVVYGILFYLSRLFLRTVISSPEEPIHATEMREIDPVRGREQSNNSSESKPVQRIPLHRRGDTLPKGSPLPYMEYEANQMMRSEIHTEDIVPSLIGTGERELPLLQQQFGDYTLIRQIGQGGYANVYLGVHTCLKSEVALKLLDLSRASNEEINRFQFEARMLARLRHRHIVRMRDFGWEKNTPFMVMEYAPGGTLQEYFPPRVPLLLPTILPAVLQIASALQYIHDQGLIHCDVKPKNMLLGPEKEVWLSDLGIARTITAAKSNQLITDELIGTPLYLAPERISGSPVPASDQYALAVMVYQWLCGRGPFQGTSLQVCLQHWSTPPPRLRDHVPSISPAVEQVVLKALAKDPQRRFVHVQRFAEALKQASLTERGMAFPRFMKQPTSSRRFTYYRDLSFF